MFLPDLEVQRTIGEKVRALEANLADGQTRLRYVLRQFDQAAVGEIDLDIFVAHIDRMVDPTHEVTDEERALAAPPVLAGDPFAQEDHAEMSDPD